MSNFPQIRDFPDRLSPMLVKELRQGMRTNGFVILFLTLQSLLGFIILIASAVDGTNSGDFITGVILFLFAIALLVVQPLRGISSLSSEINGNTIDLMVLTKLSAWRIVFGKWSSIVGQSALIFITIIPYLIFRYFFGGMQLFAELLFFFSIFLLSAGLTAVMIGISAVGSALFRGLVAIVSPTFWFLMTWAMMFADVRDEFIDFLTFQDSNNLWIYLGLFLSLLYVTYFFLEVGARQIAPLAENRSTTKRFISIVFYLIGFGILLFFVHPGGAIVIGSIFLALLSLDLLTERQDFPSSICRPFLRFGSLGKIAGRFLYPGWPAGSLLLVTLALLQTFLLSARYGFQLDTVIDSASLREVLAPSLALIGAIFLPAAIIRLFIRKGNHLAQLISIHLIAIVLLFVSSILSNFTSEKTIYWVLGSVIPHIQIPLTDRPDSSPILLLSAATATIYLLVSFITALLASRAYANREAEELQNIEDQTS